MKRLFYILTTIIILLAAAWLVLPGLRDGTAGGEAPVTDSSPGDGSDSAPSAAEDDRTDSSVTANSVVSSASRYGAANDPSHADILAEAGDLSDPDERQRVVAAMQAMDEELRELLHVKAAALGLPLRIEMEDGTVQELMGFEDGRPIYFTTHNVKSAITTGVHWLQEPPYSLDGAGGVIGVWDSGLVRVSHREFEGRVQNIDSGEFINHATHVAGTLAAAGISSSVRGMAPRVRLDAYDWHGDKSEMTSRGAAYPGEPGSIYLSNHSYGGVAGWNRTSDSNTTVDWQWFGSGTSADAVDLRFGRYTSIARDSDALARSLPYYLMFRSAGNDRSHNPLAASKVDLAPGNPRSVIADYDPAIHPAGDGQYLGGYNTVSFDGIAKNVVTVGAVNDAVKGGNRDLSNATMTAFSSWGPTNDGRIKPDLVANGDRLTSAGSSSNFASSTLSGTSMSAPNATGSAMLLVQKFDRLFPGHAMRASTLKGLLIHTADDLGEPGPDYQFGWGLINALDAVKVIETYHSHPQTRALIEDRVHPERLQREYAIVWDGETPIRATLSWTDPSVPNLNELALRSPHLVNDLDLYIEGPDGEIYHPYVMPFVGDWSEESLSLPATTGQNRTDNVEQVFIGEPPVVGVYTATVTYNGSLVNDVQNFSLILSGGVEAEPSVPRIHSVTPQTGTGGPVTFTISGEDLMLGAEVRLVFGALEIPLHGIEASGDRLRARLNDHGLAAVSWDLRVTNPDGQVVEYASAYNVLNAAYAEDFEDGASNWTTEDNRWVLSTNQSNSPEHSMFAAANSGNTISNLVSPLIDIPEEAENLRFSFWHRFNLTTEAIGGILEISVNGGDWVDVVESSTGLEFVSGGYNGQLRSTGWLFVRRNPLGERMAWSGDSGGAFRQVVIDFKDLESYLGSQIRFRWRLGVRQGASSHDWYIDDVALSAAISLENLPPTTVVPAYADKDLVKGTSVNLSVEADDNTGERALFYTWSADDEFEYPVQFSDNATNSARQTTATFSKAGIYHFQVVVRDPEGLTTSSSVEVEVIAVPSSVHLTPETTALEGGESLPFVAGLQDQFGHSMETPQQGLDWQAQGGRIDDGGLFTAGYLDGEFPVMATLGEISGSATVKIQGLFNGEILPELQLDSVQSDFIHFSISAGMPPGTYLLEWSASLAADSWQVLESYEFAEFTEHTAITLEFPGEGFLRLRYVPDF